MTEDSEPVVVWRPLEERPSSWGPGRYALPDSGKVPRVVGTSGLGSSVQEEPELRWSSVVGRSLPLVRVLGETTADRDAVIDSLIETYRSEVGGEVVRVNGSRASLGPLDHPPSGSRDESAGPVLVVIEGDRIPDRYAWQRWDSIGFVASEIAYRTYSGQPDSRSMLVVAPVGGTAFWSGVEGPEVVEVFALRPFETSPEVGERLFSALWNDVRSAAGLAAAVSGTPLEWVFAFEDGETSA